MFDEDDFVIIENTPKARDKYGHAFGSQVFTITRENIEALLSGKQLACNINYGEYVLFIVLEDKE